MPVCTQRPLPASLSAVLSHEKVTGHPPPWPRLPQTQTGFTTPPAGHTRSSCCPRRCAAASWQACGLPAGRWHQRWRPPAASCRPPAAARRWAGSPTRCASCRAAPAPSSLQADCRRRGGALPGRRCTALALHACFLFALLYVLNIVLQARAATVPATPPFTAAWRAAQPVHASEHRIAWQRCGAAGDGGASERGGRDGAGGRRSQHQGACIQRGSFCSGECRPVLRLQGCSGRVLGMCLVLPLGGHCGVGGTCAAQPLAALLLGARPRVSRRRHHYSRCRSAGQLPPARLLEVPHCCILCTTCGVGQAEQGATIRGRMHERSQA